MTEVLKYMREKIREEKLRIPRFLALQTKEKRKPICEVENIKVEHICKKSSN